MFIVYCLVFGVWSSQPIEPIEPFELIGPLKPFVERVENFQPLLLSSHQQKQPPNCCRYDQIDYPNGKTCYLNTQNIC